MRDPSALHRKKQCKTRNLGIEWKAPSHLQVRARLFARRYACLCLFAYPKVVENCWKAGVVRKRRKKKVTARPDRFYARRSFAPQNNASFFFFACATIVILTLSSSLFFFIFAFLSGTSCTHTASYASSFITVFFSPRMQRGLSLGFTLTFWTCFPFRRTCVFFFSPPLL